MATDFRTTTATQDKAILEALETLKSDTRRKLLNLTATRDSWVEFMENKQYE